jgi:beta-galactosidase
MLDACDRVGMLVVDEAFDMWTSGKSEFDYSLSFPEWWERDIEAMVAKDFNHPSVVLYSIGNEIPETGSAAGSVLGAQLAEKVRSLDASRYVTNAVNGMLAVMADLASMRKQADDAVDEGAGINTLMADPAHMMNAISTSELVTRRTAESFALLDVAGMNYMEARYAPDRELFPNRIILGTETFATRIDGNWRLVKQYGHVIGDFAWTGWDYLGEVGIGRPQYAPPKTRGPPSPHHTRICWRDRRHRHHRPPRPASYYREIVFGLRTQPYLAVKRPEQHGKTFAGTPWAWSDAIASWTWPGFETARSPSRSTATPTRWNCSSTAAPRAAAPSARTIGSAPSSRRSTSRASCWPSATGTASKPAAASCDPRSARSLRAEADRPVVTAAGGDLAYITFTLTDADGILHTAADRLVSVEVSGAGTLVGFGSAAPSTEERFDAGERRRTYEGRALAVVRPTGVGEIRLTATAAGCEPVEVTVTVGSA